MISYGVYHSPGESPPRNFRFEKISENRSCLGGDLKVLTLFPDAHTECILWIYYQDLIQKTFLFQQFNIGDLKSFESISEGSPSSNASLINPGLIPV